MPPEPGRNTAPARNVIHQAFNSKRLQTGVYLDLNFGSKPQPSVEISASMVEKMANSYAS
ncbi:hypothetical protein N7536_012477 [Penicillium majusculum]|nr:hypothetical protein N7536_012477 [Penicillium majusculum]